MLSEPSLAALRPQRLACWGVLSTQTSLLATFSSQTSGRDYLWDGIIRRQYLFINVTPLGLVWTSGWTSCFSASFCTRINGNLAPLSTGSLQPPKAETPLIQLTAGSWKRGKVPGGRGEKGGGKIIRGCNSWEVSCSRNSWVKGGSARPVHPLGQCWPGFGFQPPALPWMLQRWLLQALFAPGFLSGSTGAVKTGRAILSSPF